MTDVDGQAARDDGPAGWHPWLVLLLVATFAPRGLDAVLSNDNAQLLAHDSRRFWFPLASGVMEIVGLAVAGIAVDRYGIRNVAALSLAAWAIAGAVVSVTSLRKLEPLEARSVGAKAGRSARRHTAGETPAEAYQSGFRLGSKRRLRWRAEKRCRYCMC